MMQTAALFDLDGVIIDTEPQYTTFWAEIGRQYFPEIPDFALSVKGGTLTNIFNKYFAGCQSEQAAITDALIQFEQNMKFPEVPGAFRFVAELRAKGILTAVVTSSNKDKMCALYAQMPDLTDRFDKIFTAEDSARSKPAPDCFVNAARRMGFDPHQCYVFEDSVNGLQAAVDSGACVVGLSTSNPEDVVRNYTPHVIPNFENFTVDHLLALRHSENN